MRPESAYEAAQQWLVHAEDDPLSAETLLANQDRAWRVAAFHAQQGAEKAIKAVLVAHDRVIPRMHDLVTLAALLPSRGKLDVGDLASLNPRAVAGRYPGDIPDATRQQAEDLLTAAQRIVVAARSLVDETAR